MNNEMFSKTIHPGVRIGHVHLKVADLERAIGFYRDVLGFEVTQRYGRQAAFLSAGGYHHHIGLNTWESLGGVAAAPKRHGALSPGDCVSNAGRTRRRLAATDSGRD